MSGPDDPGRDVDGSGVAGRVVEGAVLPGSPGDTDPGAGEGAHGAGVSAAAASGVVVGCRRLGGGVPGVVGEAGRGGPQVLVAGPPADDAAALARGARTGRTPASAAGRSSVGKRSRASPGPARIRAAQTRPARGNDMTILPSGSSATACSTRDDSLAIPATRRSSRRAGARTIPPSASASCPGRADGRGAQPGGRLGGRPSPAVGVPSREAGRATPSRGGRRCPGSGSGRRRRARPGRRRTGSDGGAGPGTLQQAAGLVGERDAPGRQVVAAAHQGVERLDVVLRRAVGERKRCPSARGCRRAWRRRPGRTCRGRRGGVAGTH